MIQADTLLRPASGLPPGASTLDSPLDHLLACHRRIEDKLDILQRISAHLESNRAEAVRALSACNHFFDTNGALHTLDEELSVFPRLRAAGGSDDSEFLAGLEHDHQLAGELHRELKQIAQELEGAPAGPLPPLLAERYATVVARLNEVYRKHIAAEDRTVIELGRRLLTDDDLRAAAQEMRRRRGLAG
ncbi:MAG: hemerythrin domain-containing protein [Acidobacteria bacterium]|nr:hemerythrin domain-containing protein [Acidobacteriota bacterium]MBI3281640.1 hemerythrin domain-containing protein [Acidobacteriota bacterium]